MVKRVRLYILFYFVSVDFARFRFAFYRYPTSVILFFAIYKNSLLYKKKKNNNNINKKQNKKITTTKTAGRGFRILGYQERPLNIDRKLRVCTVYYFVQFYKTKLHNAPHWLCWHVLFIVTGIMLMFYYC